MATATLKGGSFMNRKTIRISEKSVGLSNICYSEFKYSRSTSLGVFHPSGRMGKSL